LDRIAETPGLGRLALLGGVNLAIWAVISRWRIPGDALPGIWGLPGVVWYAALPLGVAALVAALSRPQVSWRAAVQAALLAAPIMLVVQWLDPLGIAVSVLTVPLVLFAGQRLTARLQWCAAAAAGLSVVLFFWLDAHLYVQASLWYPAQDEAVDSRTHWQASEQLLFDQAAMIDGLVAAMPPGSETGTSYLVGFAGFGEEKVFAEEIRFAARVLGERYDAIDRSLLLINDQRDTTAYPLASAAGLAHALSRVAQHMKVDRDLLILVLASHGSDAPALAVSNPPVPFRDLDAALLKNAIQHTEIRWKLIIISACYAGSFIEQLAGPYTAILTAAAADRTSFGCSNSRELTYFGEHFYRDALPGADSLRGAFDAARETIEARELAEGLQPSDPQAYFGEHIERRLQQAQADTLRKRVGSITRSGREPFVRRHTVGDLVK